MSSELFKACKKLVKFADEVLPQAGKLCFDVGNLNDALCTARPAIKAAQQESTVVTYLLEQCKEYRDTIRPMRDAADNDEGSYDEYDEAYNVWLEGLHQYIVTYLEANELLEAE